MSDITETDNNAMIAKFMGDEKIHPRKRDYQKSWDWLIPVANKILYIGITDMTVNIRMRHDSGFIARMCLKQMFYPSDINNQLNITTVYLRVCDFIKWYYQKPT